MKKKQFQTDMAWAITLLFLWFWACEGWERIDCSLGVTKACSSIEMEYIKAEQDKMKRAKEERQ